MLRLSPRGEIADPHGRHGRRDRGLSSGRRGVEQRLPRRSALCDVDLANAALRPFANCCASSFAQKCMKNSRGWSSSMWLCTAVTSMPLSRNAFSTGFTSFATSTKSPVIAALPPPVGWKLMAIAEPIASGTSIPPSLIGSARGMLNW